MEKVKGFVKEHKTYLSDQEIDFLTNYDAIISYVYGLPKIHKCNRMKKS